jgi:high-affinity nickel-transport protein
MPEYTHAFSGPLVPTETAKFDHIGGIVLYLTGQGEVAGAGGLAGAGVLAYVLGMRHASTHHIAVIDDTTRAMIYRGRRPVGIGFFFAMGHSSVVVILALLIWRGAASIDGGTLTKFSDTGGTIAAVVTLLVLVLVALLNGIRPAGTVAAVGWDKGGGVRTCPSWTRNWLRGA